MARMLELAVAPTAQTAGSLAEGYVRGLLEKLPDDYTVIGGITVLDDDGQRPLTEFDTVVITPLGAVCVLEVKSGSLDVLTAGTLVRQYKDDAPVKNITEQLARQGQILATRMKAFGERVIFSHFLVLPNGTLSAAGAVLNHLEGRVFDSTSIETLPLRIVAMNEEAAATGHIVEAKKLEEFFVSHYTYRPDAAAICDAIAAARKKTEAGLAAWVPRIRTTLPFVVVEAPAGAGKTALAAKLLRLAGERHEKSIYLTFVRNTAERMIESGAGVRASFVGTWHELARECEGATRDLSKLSAEEAKGYFDYCSELLMRALSAGRYAWDCIIVDDAQSFRPEWLEALPAALTATGRLYILSDSYARVFEDREPIAFDADETLYVTLDESLRVPQRQAEELKAFHLVGPEFRSTAAFAGDNTFIAERYTGPDSLYKATRRTLEQFLSRGFRPDQIAVLSCKGWENSEILKCEAIGGRRLRRPTGRFDANNMRVFTEGEIYCDTVRRFCGLAAPCVIVTEMDFATITEHEKALLYLAMTRAEAALAFVMSERGYLALLDYVRKL